MYTPIRPLLLTCTVVVLLGGCRERETVQTAAEVQAPAPPAEAAGEMHNRLTDAEAAEGWRLLFDGRTLDGWRGYASDSLPDGWSASDQSIYFNGEGSGDLVSREQFDSFELAIDWKISPAGNSGLFFHVSEEFDYPWRTGPEVQVLDDAAHPDALNGPDRLAGANYALHAPSKNVVRPAGEWNELRLVVNGPHVEHRLNGEEIVAYELWSDDWKARVAASKFDEMPDYGMRETGHLALQDHDNPVWFRNIKIRPLAGTR